MSRMRHVVVVEDHRELLDLIGELFVRNGYRVTKVLDGSALRSVLKEDEVDLLVLDLGLPGEDGLSVCQFVRGKYPQLAIIILTARGEETDRVVGLELGADDYIPKPFGSAELLARSKAVLRRTGARELSGPSSPASYLFEGWALRLDKRELQTPEGVTVPLSTGEYNLLRTLAENPLRVLSRDQLLDLTKGRSAAIFDRAIDIQVSRLRRKLRDDAREPKLIKTVWGGGYMFATRVTSS